MNTEKKVHSRFICVHLCSSVVLFSGCGNPNAANIELRKRLADMETQVQDLKRQHEGDVASIRALQPQQSAGSAVPSLPPERLDKLFTTHGLSLGRLTAGADLDPNKPGDEAVKIYVAPTDDAGQPLKAAGSFVIEAFDLAKQSDNLAGRWQFNVDQAKQSWFGQAMLYTYVLTCPFQQAPAHSELTVKVTFRDELTGREFSIQKVVKVALPTGSPQ